MIKINDREKAEKELEEGKLENVFNIFPNLSDKVIDYNEEQYKIIDLIDDTFEDARKYESSLRASLFILSGVQSRMKQLFSISEVPLALTSEKTIEKLSENIFYNPNEELLKESNIRSFLSKYDENYKTKIVEKQKNNGKINLDREIKFNNYFIQYFNRFTKEYLIKTKTECNIHIWDCSVLDVNFNNENYEGSTITTKGGEKLRGYKIGVLRGVTPNGGVIEEICMDTAKTHDLDMSKETLLNSKYLKPEDYLLMDRGFLDIKTFKKLTKKDIKVIIPAKKSMEIFETAVSEAKEKNQWKKHPNKKRKGQDITLVQNLENFWLEKNDKEKKPKNLKLEYKINVCVIRFEKDKNKNVLTDDEITSTDDKYAYACIMTNDTDLSCDEIIKHYEMRPEIEEDFRQLKDFWGLNAYKSTSYTIISFIILICLMGYNFYQIYKESEEGKAYISKSFIIEEKHGIYMLRDVRTAIVTENYYYFYNQADMFDLYASLNIEKREQIKSHLAH